MLCCYGADILSLYSPFTDVGERVRTRRGFAVEPRCFFLICLNALSALEKGDFFPFGLYLQSGMGQW
jgi:hypothetical protein